MKTGLHPNEIRDYLARAPKRWQYQHDGSMVNNTGARLKWLVTLCQGTLDERINRRAGILDTWLPWKKPVRSAIARNQRKYNKAGFRFYHGYSKRP
jgi:hypothetical protein